ncbi:hypothetical protein [Saccharothrix sp. NRRL B-16314]|uniref:hypothetical protein n=1 Tax=Saccharothrix sp. NRRL B-16314 TaxID=1463825 RepID=UPI0018CC30A8|nr:hypothetical protein [Saccharothrix sp. NRRL B-16314]
MRKHMEHIFDRTGARSRAAAAALVIPHLSAIDPGWRHRDECPAASAGPTESGVTAWN